MAAYFFKPVRRSGLSWPGLVKGNLITGVKCHHLSHVPLVRSPSSCPHSREHSPWELCAAMQMSHCTEAAML
uniref:Uncharacterized protein G30 n=1 Tax=Homo sapiens TaxID=9606 RepID=Q8IU97_HUMAN|nr:putative protein LG30 [Homo sapiens]AAN16029.1 putative protein LG30 [Homo sapiens]